MFLEKIDNQKNIHYKSNHYTNLLLMFLNICALTKICLKFNDVKKTLNKTLSTLNTNRCKHCKYKQLLGPQDFNEFQNNLEPAFSINSKANSSCVDFPVNSLKILYPVD